MAKKAKPQKKITPKPKKSTDASTKKIRIKIIGIGGGGGNIIKELSKKLDFSSNKIDFLAINTDMQALEALPKSLKKLSFGEKETLGLGTGRDIKLGEEIASKEENKINKIFSDNKDLYIFVSSLGGGTGTGSIPVFSRIARELNLTTLGIFTLPFNFEGKEKMREAQRAIERARVNLNATLVLPNERIFKKVDEDIPFNSALNIINDLLANSLQGLLNTVYSSGLINIDWADIRTTIEGGNKMAYLNMTRAKLSEDLEDFTERLLKNKIIDYDFSTSTNILFNIEGGKELSMKQLALISKKISEFAPNAKIIFGLSQNSKFKNEIRATVLATGILKEKKPVAKIKEKPKEKKEEKPQKKKKEIQKPKEKKEEKKPKIEQIEKELKELEEMGVEINRRNAVEIKKAEEEARKKEEEEEDIFEIPAFLRKKKD